jgi:hypothetical protein
MREIRQLFIDIDRQLEEAARAKQQLDAERWRAELRPRAMRSFAARTATLPWSRALLKLVVAELFPDDLFRELVGNLDRVPRRQWPHVIAIAVALRHSWRRDGLTRIAKRLRVSLTTTDLLDRTSPNHRHQASDRITRRRQSAFAHSRPSRHQFSGLPRPRQGSPRRSDPAKRGWRP